MGWKGILHNGKCFCRFTVFLILAFLCSCLSACSLIKNEKMFPTFNEVVTDDRGRAVLTTNFGTIEVLVEDENGAPVGGATITSYELEDAILVIASSEDFLPSIKVVKQEDFKSSSLNSYALEPYVAATTIVFTVLIITDVARTIYDYATHPEELPIQFPGLVKGSRRVKSICLQIDAKDVLAIADVVSAWLTTSKALQVLGAPAKRRGVTAINLGFTKRAIEKWGAEKIVEEILDYLELLDVDFINTCDYVYEDLEGNKHFIPVQTWEVIRPTSKKFYARDVVASLIFQCDCCNKHCNPKDVLGPPDTRHVSLGGPGGFVMVKMAEPIINGKGIDLRVYERYGVKEPFDVYLSEDGIHWIKVAENITDDPTNDYASIDISPKATTGLYWYVWIVDKSLDIGHETAGSDIDAIEGLWTCLYCAP